MEKQTNDYMPDLTPDEDIKLTLQFYADRKNWVSGKCEIDFGSLARYTLKKYNKTELGNADLKNVLMFYSNITNWESDKSVMTVFGLVYDKGVIFKDLGKMARDVLGIENGYI